MHSPFAAALALVALLSLPAVAQGVGSAPAPDPSPVASAPIGATLREHLLASTARSSSQDSMGITRSSPALSALGVGEGGRTRTMRAPSLARHLRVGAGIGAVAGAALGLWVISIADCGGPNCTTERVVGVAGNTLGGAAIGALIGGAIYLIRR